MPFWKALKPKAERLDAAGVGLSVVCLLHCAALPVAAAATPMLAPVAPSLAPALAESVGANEHDHLWHLVLLAIAAPVAIIGLGWGVRVARGGWRTFLIGMIGLALMAVGSLHLFGDLANTMITLAGVTVLTAAHVANWRSRARRGHDHASECNVCETASPN